MKDEIQNLIFNTLNGTVEKLKGNATSFERKLKAFSDQHGGTFTVPHARFNSPDLDPRYRDLLSGTLSAFASMPLVRIQHKGKDVVFSGFWQAPPPIGSIVIVSLLDSVHSDLKFGVKAKKRLDFDFAKAFFSASMPSDDAMHDFLKAAMPNFQYQDALENEIKERQAWMKLPETRSGVIELDKICTFTSSDPKLAQKIFSDWKAREPYLRIAPRTLFYINGQKSLTTLIVQSSAELDDLKNCLDFIKSLVDRSPQLNISK